MRFVLADTGPLYALVDPSDRYHERSHRELSEISEGGHLLVAFSTALEGYGLVLRRLGFPIAQTWWRELIDGVGMLTPTNEVHREAGRVAGLYPDQKITLFDAVVAVMATQLRAPVWTYDFHFGLMQVEVWRGP